MRARLPLSGGKEPFEGFLSRYRSKGVEELDGEFGVGVGKTRMAGRRQMPGLRWAAHPMALCRGRA